MGHMSGTKVGDRVEIVRCYDAYTKLKRGTQGTVTLIDGSAPSTSAWMTVGISDSSRARGMARDSRRGVAGSPDRLIPLASRTRPVAASICN
jgi:hypothetical protein